MSKQQPAAIRLPALMVVSLSPWPISTLLRLLLRRWLGPPPALVRIARLLGWILLLWLLWR